MANMIAEEFLRQVRMVAEANDISLDSIEFSLTSGMHCSWFNPGDADDDIIWSAEMGEARQ